MIFIIDHAALHKSEAPDITTHKSVLNIYDPSDIYNQLSKIILRRAHQKRTADPRVGDPWNSAALTPYAKSDFAENTNNPEAWWLRG